MLSRAEHSSGHLIAELVRYLYVAPDTQFRCQQVAEDESMIEELESNLLTINILS